MDLFAESFEDGVTNPGRHAAIIDGNKNRYLFLAADGKSPRVQALCNTLAFLLSDGVTSEADWVVRSNIHLGCTDLPDLSSRGGGNAVRAHQS